MFKKLVCFILLLAMLGTIGCYTQNFIVGSGPKGNTVVAERQWYILFGLVPLNTVDTQKMAGGATNYKIMTQQSIVDVVINIFTGIVTVASRTVEVTK
jgi:hypothetical protein